jgi:autotransporter-associated beta strand protein
MKLSFSLRSMVLAACALAISSKPALLQAADGTWTQNANGDWSTPGNWSGGTVADGQNSTAFLSDVITSARIINLDTARTIGNIFAQDTSHDYTISGANTLTLDVSTGTPIIDVVSGRTLSISSVIAGANGLQKDGPGTLTLSGVNTYTGGTFLTGGTLGVTSANSITAFGANDFSISGGARVNLRGVTTAQNVTIGAGGGVFANGGNNNYTTTGILSGSDTLTNLNVGGAASRVLSFNSTANDFTGGIIIEGLAAQTVQFNSLADSANNIAFTRSATSGVGTGTFRYGSGAITGLTLDSRAFEINSSDLVNNIVATIENANTTHAITINTDLVVTGTGAKTLGLTAAAGPTNVFAGDIANETDGGAGIVSVLKSGAGTWELSGNNTYTGNTTISAGTLTLADPSSTLFDIGASGINNSILGTGTVNLNGEFFFDLTGASTNNGDFWNIVNVGTLSETYGSTFSVDSSLGSFTDNAGVWSLVDGGNTWTFSQSSGVLSIAVVPEPGTLALLAGGAFVGVALLRRRRHSSV